MDQYFIKLIAGPAKVFCPKYVIREIRSLIIFVVKVRVQHFNKPSSHPPFGS